MMPKASSVFQAAGRDSTVTFSIKVNSFQAKVRTWDLRVSCGFSLPSEALLKNRQFGARDPQNESRGSSVALVRLHRLRAFGLDCPDEHTTKLCRPEFARAGNARSGAPRSARRMPTHTLPRVHAHSDTTRPP